MRALLIGRFQPFHKGHAELTRLISDEYKKVIIGIGSAQSSYVVIESESGDESDFIFKIDCGFSSHTIENPFTAEERSTMIKEFLNSEGIKNYEICNIPDINVYSVSNGERTILPLYYGKKNSDKGVNKVSVEILSSPRIDLSRGYRILPSIPIKKASEWINQGISKEGWKLSTDIISSVISSDETPLIVSSIPRETLLEWVDYVISIVPKFEVVFSNNQLTRELFSKAGYKVKETPLFNRKEYSGTEIRRRMIHDEKWEHLVPESIFYFIKKIKGEERIKKLVETEK